MFEIYHALLLMAQDPIGVCIAPGLAFQPVHLGQHKNERLARTRIFCLIIAIAECRRARISPLPAFCAHEEGWQADGKLRQATSAVCNALQNQNQNPRTQSMLQQQTGNIHGIRHLNRNGIHRFPPRLLVHLRNAQRVIIASRVAAASPRERCQGLSAQ